VSTVNAAHAAVAGKYFELETLANQCPRAHRLLGQCTTSPIRRGCGEWTTAK
jgi:hypothetical protein